MSVSARLRDAATVSEPLSLSNRLRDKRIVQFAVLIAAIPRPVRLLDIGGTTAFWERRGWHEYPDVKITVANLADALHDRSGAIEQIHADATDLSRFDDHAFDVVFSNSTIEHLFSWQAQQRMAEEARRLAPVYWIQTPNLFFPVEPHFLTPGWQFLPVRARARILERHRIGHRGPVRSPAHARSLAEEIRLLSRRDMRLLFPDAEIRSERVGPLTKSLIAIRA